MTKCIDILKNAWIALLAIVLTTACSDILSSDDEQGGQKGIELTYRVTEFNDMDQASRAASPTPANEVRELTPTVNGDKMYLHFSTQNYIGTENSLLPTAESRAVQITNDNFISQNPEISIVGLKQSPEDKTAHAAKVFLNEYVKFANGWFSTKYWPTDAVNIDFYSLVPFPKSGAESKNDPTSYLWSNSDLSEGSCLAQRMVYSVNTQSTAENGKHANEGMPDILYARTTGYSGSHYSIVSLNYQHLLSAFGVVCLDVRPGLILTGLDIKGIYTRADYAYDNDKQTYTWTNYSNKTDIHIDLDATSTGTQGQFVMGNTDDKWMFIPQTFGDDGKIVLHYKTTATGEDKTIEASMKNMTLQQGKTMWCALATTGLNWNYTLTVQSNRGQLASSDGHTYYEIETSYQEEQFPIVIDSYKSNITNDAASSSKQEPVAWQLEYATTENYPSDSDWKAIDPKKAQGSFVTMSDPKTDIHQAVQVSVSKQTPQTTTHNALWEKHASVGTETSPFDLSRHDVKNNTISQSTANCYVVHTAGWFTFPIVYGNAIKRGRINTAAFAESNPGMNKAFKDYSGALISSSNYKPAKASSVEIISQDVDKLINTSSLVIESGKLENGSECQYVKFYINPQDIQQGNAIVAVRDADGKVIWSWHIWVTDLDVSTLNSNSDDYMAYPLGWKSSSGEAWLYPQRSLWVRISQVGRADLVAAPQVAHFIQKEGVEDKAGSAHTGAYFQFGRKDAFLMNGGSYDAKVLIQGDGEDVSVSKSIQNPTTVYNVLTRTNYDQNFVNSHNWTSPIYHNFWSALSESSSEEIPVKSVYDPSPVGYRVPRGRNNVMYAFIRKWEQMGYYHWSQEGGASTSDNVTLATSYPSGTTGTYDKRAYWTCRPYNIDNNVYGIYVPGVAQPNADSYTTYRSNLLPVRSYVEEGEQ